MHNKGTVPTFKMHNVRTVPTSKMHNVGTVPTFKMYNIGTTIFFFFSLNFSIGSIRHALLFSPYNPNSSSEKIIKI